ncbi:unnamed protein product [Soboliphyme baturini]|uniref:Uncharacterized protein n=1 Tax=Soboliphyme baturini TaxID=241478 RepID=A0A183J4K1_9BILA|nr:unnamed protein product [Soboliphyme baturini]
MKAGFCERATIRCLKSVRGNMFVVGEMETEATEGLDEREMHNRQGSTICSWTENRCVERNCKFRPEVVPHSIQLPSQPNARRPCSCKLVTITGGSS